MYPYSNSKEYEMNFLSIETKILTRGLLRRIGVKWFLYTIKFSHISLKCTTSQKHISPTKNISGPLFATFHYAIYFLISGTCELCHIK